MRGSFILYITISLTLCEPPLLSVVRSNIINTTMPQQGLTVIRNVICTQFMVIVIGGQVKYGIFFPPTPGISIPEILERQLIFIIDWLGIYRLWLNIVWVTAVKTQDKKFPIVASEGRARGLRRGLENILRLRAPLSHLGPGAVCGETRGKRRTIKSKQHASPEVLPFTIWKNKFPTGSSDTLSDRKSFIYHV